MKYTMPAGKYYIGDLCYVMHERWDEFCDITCSGPSVLDGVFVMADGIKLATFSTMYGDGQYYDNIGRSYGVDAGLIGCVLVSDLDLDNKENDIECGHVHTFDAPFHVYENEGLIVFGELRIDTGESDYDEEE